MKGYIHSLQSLGTVDGPGVRAVIFSSGCPLRCIYCHNPDTWDMRAGSHCESDELAERIIRLYPYIKNGGVTYSGGEPCLQAEFFCELSKRLKDKGLHIALDTSGCVDNSDVDKLLGYIDLVLLDIKFTTEEDYKRYTGGSLDKTLRFLDKLEKLGKDTWIRHVVVPGMNDTEEDILRLRGLISPYSCIKKVELLPFKTLCIEKYKSLGIDFPLADTPQMDSESIDALKKILE